MPCNDPSVYLDRARNLARGLGYVDSYSAPDFAPKGSIYQKDVDNYKAQTKTPLDRLNFLTSKMCMILETLEKDEYKNLKTKIYEENKDLCLWSQDHNKWDKKREKTKKALEKLTKKELRILGLDAE